MTLRNYCVAALACVLLVSGCKFTEKDASKTEAVASDVTVAEVKSSLDQKNFGEASALSDKLTAANPTSVDAWLVAADAKALSGSRLAALAALENAMINGMHDANRLDADGYLDSLRSSNEYQALLVRFDLARPIVQSGDTSINETSAGTVVRAGGVSVTLPNSK
ncbi:hypothetical protein [Caballeronia sp.]|uniref:hypothetical protein n=1 Tax=Caballeronia sp. TaxID=1931223 RepID=UPI003C48F79E